MQSRTANATIRVVEHGYQVVHNFGHQKVIKELTAPITNISAVMMKPFSNHRKRGQAAP
jgi:hypothetical protein